MSTELIELETLAKDLNDLKSQIANRAKGALREGLTRLFAEYDISIIAWGQKTSEYNDEGLYPGIAGPCSNATEEELKYGDFAHNGTVKDNVAADTFLKRYLKAIGEENLVDLFGDEYITIATRIESGFKVESEYGGV